MEFRKSNKKDLPKIMTMIEDARVALKGLGIDQWQDGHPSESCIVDDIEAGDSYVALNEDKMVIGHASLTFDNEPAYETVIGGEWQSDEPYGTIHRVATDKNAKNKGVASFLFQKFEQLCLGKKVDWIRIDTHEGNIPMQSLIAKFGYKKAGTVYYNPKTKRIGFDKRLG